MADKRQHRRTALKARVKLFLDGQAEGVMHTMKDMSNGGIFLFTDNKEVMPELGSSVKVQMQGMMEDAPIIEARVVRIDKDGFGLEFTE